MKEINLKYFPLLLLLFILSAVKISYADSYNFICELNNIGKFAGKSWNSGDKKTWMINVNLESNIIKKEYMMLNTKYSQNFNIISSNNTTSLVAIEDAPLVFNSKPSISTLAFDLKTSLISLTSLFHDVGGISFTIYYGICR